MLDIRRITLNIFVIGTCINFLNAMDLNAEQTKYKQVDSLLSEGSYKQAEILISNLDIEDNHRSAYLKLAGDLAYLPNFNLEELIEICDSGLRYTEQFSYSYSGPEALSRYQNYEQLYRSRLYHDAVVAYKFANFYKYLYIASIVKTTNQSIDSSEALYTAGNYREAIELIKLVEADVNKYMLLKDRRWEIEANTNKYRNALATVQNETSFKDTAFHAKHLYDISLVSNFIGAGAEFDELKPVLILHSTMTAYNSFKYLNKFKLTGGISGGFEMSKRIMQRTGLNVRCTVGKAYYTGENDSTGLNSGLTTNFRSIALGGRYDFRDRGRVDYFSSIYFVYSRSTVGKKITIRHSNLEYEYYFIAPVTEYDQHVECDFGVTYFPISRTNIIYRGSIGFLQSVNPPELFGPRLLTAIFSIGYYF